MSQKNLACDRAPVPTQTEELQKIYYSTRDEIRGFLLSHCRNSAEADDLMQQVYIRLIELLEAGRVHTETVRPFLYRLAYHAFIDSRRSDRRERTALQEFAESPPQTSNNAQLSDQVQQIIAGTIQRNRLTTRQTHIARLRFQSGTQVTRIAEILQISRKSVHRELKRVYAVLRPEFEAAGLTPEALDDSTIHAGEPFA